MELWKCGMRHVGERVVWKEKKNALDRGQIKIGKRMSKRKPALVPELKAKNLILVLNNSPRLCL